MYTSYFWDSENVSPVVLEHIEELDKSDKLYIFHSLNSGKASLDIVEKIRKAKCYIEFIECENGTPNAMDFEIVSFIGLKVGGYKHKENKHHYIILSKDKGYDSAIRFLQTKNINVERRADLIYTLSETEEEQKKQKMMMYDTIIRDCIIQSTDLSSFHHLLQVNPNEYVKKNFTELYKSYKSKYKEIKNSV